MTSTVHLQDCMELLKTYPDNNWSLAVCDIPYGIDVGNMPYLKEVNTTVLQKNGTRINGNKNKSAYKNKDWDKAIPTQKYFDELKRVAKHQIIFGVNYVDWTGLGTGRIIWNKGVPEGMSFSKTETAYCSLIDDAVTCDLLWAGMQQAESLTYPMRQQGNKKLNEKRIHPCHKPILLYDWIYHNYAKPNDKILDTHAGSMSSVVSALKAGLNITAFEIDKDYFEAGKKRVLNYTSQLNMFQDKPLIEFIIS